MDTPKPKRKNAKPKPPHGTATAKILVAPADQNRFVAGCEHYGMVAKRVSRSDYFFVEFSDPSDLYWLGANMFGHPDINSSITKRSF